MQIGQVTGNVWATRKEDELRGVKFLIVQPILPSGDSVDYPFIAVDRIGAGTGDKVMITRGSSAANLKVPSTEQQLPIDALIIGIIDSLEVMRGETSD